jgi:hypothetical protein
MDAFIGTMEFVLVAAVVSGLFAFAGMLPDGKYTQRRAGVSLLALSVVQALAIIMTLANPMVLMTPTVDAIEMIMPMLWAVMNLIVGVVLVMKSLRQPQPPVAHPVTPPRIYRRPGPSM